MFSNEVLRALVQAIGRGALVPTTFPIARDNHGSRNRFIAIAKLITEFQGEGDPITYMECFEQVCAAFRDVLVIKLEPLEFNWMARRVIGIGT